MKEYDSQCLEKKCVIREKLIWNVRGRETDSNLDLSGAELYSPGIFTSQLFADSEILQYKMNEENEGSWSKEQIEEWEHDTWLKCKKWGVKYTTPTSIFSKKRRQRTTLLRRKNEEDGIKKKKKKKKLISR